MSKDITGKDVIEWTEKYEQTFGRPYPPIFSSYEEKAEDIKKRIKDNDPYPSELNNPSLVF